MHHTYFIKVIWQGCLFRKADEIVYYSYTKKEIWKSIKFVYIICYTRDIHNTLRFSRQLVLRTGIVPSSNSTKTC